MENTQQLEIVEGKQPSKLKRFLLVLFVTVLLLAGAVYAAGYVLLKGPSMYAAQQFVTAVQEHPILYMIPKLYLTDGEIAAMCSAEDADGHFSAIVNEN